MFLREELAEEVVGDLQEQYDYSVAHHPKWMADMDYWVQVFQYLRPFALKRKSGYTQANPFVMYRSYFLTALRGMVKNKLHTFINIAGLSVGLAVAIIIGLWIADETSYEKNFANYDSIGAIIQNVTNNGEVETWMNTPFPLADELRKNYGADFKHVVVTSGMYERLLSYETLKLEKPGIAAEPAFTEMLSFHMIQGKADALTDPSAILLSQSAATTYFGSSDPMGKVMTVGDKQTVHVAGVFEDIPDRSRFGGLQFVISWEMLYNNSSWMKTIDDPWRPNSFETYVQLADHANFKDASARIKDAKLKRISEALAKKKPALFIHPMSEWHLKSEFRNGMQTGGRIQYVRMFGIVGVFVLLMACINFMNLSTARSEQRSREVGIRKAVGSVRGQLISQFFSESILTTFFSLIIAVVFAQLTLPWFNGISGKHMNVPWTEPIAWITGSAFCLIIGLIAGSYPALYLSSIRAVSALKGTFKSGGASLPRKVLVTIQFAVSVTLIIGTIVVYLQIRHAQNRPLGYQTDGLVAVPIASAGVYQHADAIRNELLGNGAITEMSDAEATTTQTWGSSSQFDWDGKDPDLSVDFQTLGVGMDYGKAIDWEIGQGRDFSRDFPSDTSAFVVNEAAAKYMNLKEAIGGVVRWGGKPYQVIGVAHDVVVSSPYRQVQPMFYYLSNETNVFLMRLSPKAPAAEAIAKIETAVKRHSGDRPFSYQFMDQQYALKFDNEQRIASLASVFAALAIFISCLGTFGLSSFVAEQRTKEIGVRKVMGASLYELWRLLSTDFVLLTILSFVVAVPVAYIVLSSWLSGYEYRTALPLWPFVASTSGTLFITLLTASWHTVQAARVNPVRSLRAE